MLREHFTGHNLRVALLAVLTVVAAIILWLLLHGVAKWLTLLFATAIGGLGSTMPRSFEPGFWIAAAVLLTIAWIDRSLRPDDRPRDHKSFGEIVMEFVLLVPRVTLSLWSTLSAWQHLNAQELQLASDLVDHLAAEGRLRLQSLPLEIPQADTRFKILLALQMVQVIDVRREDRELWVRLSPLRPSALAWRINRGEAERNARLTEGR
jgi:hypothetical protein